MFISCVIFRRKIRSGEQLEKEPGMLRIAEEKSRTQNDATAGAS